MSFCVIILFRLKWHLLYILQIMEAAPLPVFFSEHHSSFSSMFVGLSKWPEYDKSSHKQP